MTDFYFVYGTDPNGNKGWYSYDSARETIQRVNERLFEMASQPKMQEEEEQGHISMQKSKADTSHFDLSKMIGSSRTIIAIAIFVMVVVLLVILDLLLLHRRGEPDELETYDEDEEVNDEREKAVPTVDKILDEKDFNEANKPHRSRKIFNREKSSDIWDTGEKMLSDTSKIAEMDDSSKLKKQVFRGRSSDNNDSDDDKIDVIDFNDL